MDDPSYEYRASWSDNSDAWVGRCDGFLLVSHLAPTEPESTVLGFGGGGVALVVRVWCCVRPRRGVGVCGGASGGGRGWVSGW